MKKVIAFLLIFIGLGVMLYPEVTDYYSAHKQEELIDIWENQEFAPGEDIGIFEQTNEQTAQTSYVQLDSIFPSSEGTVQAAEIESSQEGHNEPEAEAAEREQPLSESMMGIITIDKIDVKLPILYGASQYNLKYGAGYLSGSALPGQNGNSAIAAHRSREYGKMFNRLDEVQEGDLITVKTREGTHEYKVTSTKIVKPSDLSVLQNSSEATLTLITCDPIDNPINRLIVKAEKVK
ncbi:class D sortase [Bacillus sp. SG-1]|uniref:class D sortase n=1 Tax=Bacillus sp. SG-1 TaxID=161544 RepID=UPI00031D7276|nr:class D sortase [Bacillus sp. SG-1]